METININKPGKLVDYSDQKFRIRCKYCNEKTQWLLRLPKGIFHICIDCYSRVTPNSFLNSYNVRHF